MPDVIRHPEGGDWGWIPASAGMTGGYTESQFALAHPVRVLGRGTVYYRILEHLSE